MTTHNHIPSQVHSHGQHSSNDLALRDDNMIRPAPQGPSPSYDMDQAQAIALGNDCRRRGHCCSMGSGIAREDELAPIAKAKHMSIQALKDQFLVPITRFGTTHWKFKTRDIDKPYGPCVFFDAKEVACTIHDVKPLYCQVGICNRNGTGLVQWYNAHYFLDTGNADSVREYAVSTNGVDMIQGANVTELVPATILQDILTHSDRKHPAFIQIHTRKEVSP